MQTLFENRYQQINRDRNPDLGAHGVETRAVESFDAQMLFEPFEEQFDLPATVIKLCDGQRRLGEVVGQKDQRPTRDRIAKADPAQGVGIIAAGVKVFEHDGLIEAQACALVHPVRVTPSASKPFLGTRDKEGSALVQTMQPGKVQIAAIDDVERAGFVNQLIEDVHIVNPAGCDDHDGGIMAAQGKDGMQFEAGGVSAEFGPGKERQTQFDGGGIQRVGGGLQFGPQTLVGIELGRLPDQHLGKIGEDAPVAFFVGIGQGAAGSRFADATVIQLGAQRAQTGFDVAQTLAPRQLSKSHDQKLFVSRERADAPIATIASDTLVELVFGQAVQQLGKDSATFVHRVMEPPRGGPRPCENALPK